MRLASFAPYALSLARIVFAFLIIQHGVQKWFGLLGGLGGSASPAGSQLWIAGVIETIVGAFLLAGLFTRPAAFILCGQMAAAYFLAHNPRGFWTVQNAGEPAVLHCFFYLYVVTAGGGAWSLDRLIWKSGDKVA